MSENSEEKIEISLGRILQNKRLELEIELSKASKYLKVKNSDIEAIENDDFKNLEKKVYVFGLINSYAKFLKIPKNEIIEKLNLISNSKAEKQSKHRLINLNDENKLSPSKDSFFNFLLVAILLFLILLSIYNSYENHRGLITNKELVKELKRTMVE